MWPVDSGLAVVLGALLAVAAGLLYRVIEARNQSRHWFRDQLRMAAEKFLGDAEAYLSTSVDWMAGSSPISGRLQNLDMALAIDMSRLKFVASKSVLEAASDVSTRVKAAYQAVGKTPRPGIDFSVKVPPSEERVAQTKAAEAAINDANLQLGPFCRSG